jgi:methylated-DNA-[protein]-cysteine S-methyltransferase
MSNRSRTSPYDAVLLLPPGGLGVCCDRERLLGLDLLPPGTPEQAPDNGPALDLAHQISAYLARPGHCFDLPLVPLGTAFQRRVWARLARIPAGAPISYTDLAGQVGSGARAVANACRANPFPLVVPCHRVVARQGLGGYAGQRDGWLLDMKEWLLAHEQRD